MAHASPNAFFSYSKCFLYFSAHKFTVTDFVHFFVSFSNVLTFFFIVRSITATSMSKAWPSWVFKKQTRQPIFFKETFLFVSYAIIHYNTLLSFFLMKTTKKKISSTKHQVM